MQRTQHAHHLSHDDPDPHPHPPAHPHPPTHTHAPGEESTAQYLDMHLIHRAASPRCTTALRRPLVTMDCKSLLREPPHAHTTPRTRPRAHRTLAPRTAIVRPCLLLGRRNHPHTPPRPASHPASHPGASCTIRGRPHAPRRSRADLNPAPTASPLMRSFMAHARLAHGRGSVDVLCLSAHLTGIPPQSHRSLTARQPTIAPASRAPPYTDLPTDPPPPALVAQADCMRRSRDPPGDQP